MTFKYFNVKNGLSTGNIYLHAGNSNVVASTFIGNLKVTDSANLGNAAVANFFIGDGGLLSNISVNSSNIANLANLANSANIANLANLANSANLAELANIANIVSSSSQPNITSLGNLTTLTVEGPVYLGDVANIYISGGTSGQYLKTDGSGNLSWDTVSGGSSGSQSYITATIDSFTGDGVTTDFTLSIVPGDISQTLVNYNGAMQLRSAYTLTADVISFSEAPASGSTIEVTTTSGLTSAGGSFVYRQYTGDGSTATFTVSSACDANTVLVTLNGVLQAPTLDYTVTNGTLTFLTAPLNNERIQVRELKSAIATATISTGGSNTQVQFNDAGILGGSSGFTYNKTTQLLNIGNLAVTGKANLNSVSNITITGGTSGQYLQTDGAGNVSWANVTSGLSNARSFGFSLVFGG